MLLEEKENLGEQKLSFTITAKGLQDFLGSIEFNMDENVFHWLDDNGEFIFNQLCDRYRKTGLYKENKEEWEQINKRFKENENAKKVISIDQLRAKRA